MSSQRNVIGLMSGTPPGTPPPNPYAAGPGTPGMPAGPKPPNYLVQSILVTFCCCLPFGIVAIVFAAQVDSKYSSGDYQGALSASKNAKLWSLIGLGIGIVGNLIGFAMYALAIAGAAAQGGGF